jgi:hypothetical protein
MMMALCCCQCNHPAVDLVKDPHSQEQISYLTRLNFVLYRSEVDAYPQAKKGFEEAIQEWCKYLPLDCKITIIDDVTPYLPSIQRQLPGGCIEVRLAASGGPEFKLPHQIIGLWQSNINTLLLNGPFLEKNPEYAKRTALHELGHMLGLPHIVNSKDEDTQSGYIVVPDEIDAKKFIMYPTLLPGANEDLSELEIHLAQERILNLTTLGSNFDVYLKTE